MMWISLFEALKCHMFDVGIPSLNLPGHTLLPFFLLPSLWILYCANCQDLSSRIILVVSKVWDIIKKLKQAGGKGRWSEMKFQDLRLQIKQEGRSRDCI